MKDRPITLCVIDDIKSVVRGIADLLNEETHGVQVVGTAGNGEDGLHMVTELRPDIVLTDIRMPRMDGLEMTQRIMAILPTCKVILLSGYTDFEYAQQAIRLGAFDFLAKPFLKSAIETVVDKAREQVVLDRTQFAKQTEMERQIKESMPLLRQEYLHLLLRYMANEAMLRERWDYLKMDLNHKHLTLMCVEMDGFAKGLEDTSIHDVELARFAVKNILEETLASVTKAVVFREHLYGFVCLLNTPAEPAVLAEACREHVMNYSRYTVSIGVSKNASSIQGLPAAYQQASEALSHNFYTGGNSVFLYEDIAHRTLPVLRHSAEQEKELFNLLRMGNQEKALPLLNAMIHCYAGVTPNHFVQVCYDIGLLMCRTFSEKLSDAATVDSLTNLLERLKRGEQLNQPQLIEVLKQVVVEGCRWLQAQKEEEASSVITRAIQYMKDNLDKNVTVNELAKHVYLSASYFANLFKKVTGTTLIHYMTGLRIERAKEMLLNDSQVQEVALSLGYEDRSYFTDVFKKYTGMTPTDFKQAYKP
ncbi:response regulator [Paenibacillus roseipurpureus]|uniref:Response regulator n=1 Tax=Paenibacillus roseopurpureus TaxID=2918901 RepID=A0AA96LVC8_9BACL|nr:response regulator [Paenibacillus sp. MBLB1832]WNR45340.1 response regulator [Paenibacillus sp. MBLB1832]